LRAQNRALEAAARLASLAQWRDDEVELDRRVVFGELLSDSTKMAVRFDVEDLVVVTVMRTKLKQASRNLGFADLRCFVDGDGLNFRWRNGRGGLLLVNQSLPPKHQQSFLAVVIPRVRSAGKVPQIQASRQPRWVEAFVDAALL
jgi:hypothetical protein